MLLVDDQLEDFVRIILSKIRINDNQILSMEEFRLLPPEMMIKLTKTLAGDMLMSINAYVLGMESERIEIHCKFPADWWQAFRRRWFPLWWLHKHPIKWERVDVSEQLYSAVCPHLHADPQEKHLQFFVNHKD